MVQAAKQQFRQPSNMVVLLVAACMLTYHMLYNHSMILQSEGRMTQMNTRMNAKFETLQRQVQRQRAKCKGWNSSCRTSTF